jgi:hypothetical protein
VLQSLVLSVRLLLVVLKPPPLPPKVLPLELPVVELLVVLRPRDIQEDSTFWAAEEPKRIPLAISPRATSGLLGPCIYDFTLGDSHAKIFVGKDTIQVGGTQRNWAIVDGIPGSCITQISAYNAHANITDLNYYQNMSYASDVTEICG